MAKKAPSAAQLANQKRFTAMVKAKSSGKKASSPKAPAKKGK
jgi:hypothetical protein